MIDTQTASQAPIQLINDWLQERLQSRTAHSTPITDLHSRFVESALQPILQMLTNEQVADLIITVRSAFCQAKEYIRPVYSNPPELCSYFQDPSKQRPFQVQPSGFFEGMSEVYPLTAASSLKPDELFGAIYDLDENRDYIEDRNFRGRIQRFVDDLRATELNLRNLAASVRHCFFIGRTRRLASSTNSYEMGLPVAHFLAIYSKEKKTQVELQKAMLEADELFRGLDLIARIDATLFESEGLDLVANLLPEFARKDVANADKIAFAIEKLRDLLSRHMTGRHGGGEKKNRGVQDSSSTSLFYLTSTFEKQNGDPTPIVPRLYLYPHSYRRVTEFQSVATFVSHKSIPTATKFLLYRYLVENSKVVVATTSGSLHDHKPYEEEEVRVGESFSRLFTGIHPNVDWQSAVCPEADFLLLSRTDFDGVIWHDLQRSGSATARSIAAFVVEGKRVDGTERLYLPRGIFALESPYEDGFSDEDVRSLRAIFKGVASLVRMISHHHSPIDYRIAIASTFERDIPITLAVTRNTEQAISQFLFFTQKIDGDILRQMISCPSFDCAAFRIDEPIKALLSKMVANWPLGGEEPTPTERAEILTKRMAMVQKLLVESKKDGQLAMLIDNRVLEFLEACPENFTWSSYLTCMAQTLGDRMGPGMMPRFSRMTPGFSASGMFIASIQGQLRQVVKLSSAAKVDEESDRYRKWVRYRLVNAARIPTSAFEFETTGTYGKLCGQISNPRIDVTFEKVKKTADGILVSDLVSGESRSKQEVRTLLDTTANCIVASLCTVREDMALPELGALKEKIRAVFIDNAVLWNDSSAMRKEERDDLNQLTAIETAFRIGSETSTERNLVEKSIDRVIEFCGVNTNRLSKKSYSELIEAACPARLDKSALEESIRIVHGDMNARNLTWSEALKSFFLIDFEHTGPGIQGTDQMRLSVNLMAEIWVAFEHFHLPALRSLHVEAFHKEIDNAISYLKKLFIELIQPQGMQGLSGALSAIRPSQNGNLESLLKSIIETIDYNKFWTGEEWRAHWALMLFTAALKEFEYTCRNVDREFVKRAMDGRSMTDIGLLTELDHLAIMATRDEANSNNIRHALLRNILSGRLLGKLILALNNCCE